MPLIDVTVPLDKQLPTYDGEPGPTVARIATLESGDPATVSTLHLGLHSGTHVDAPAHLFPGARGVETLPLEALIGPAEVVELTTESAITAADLEKAVSPDVTRVLLKTRNGALWEKNGFQTDFVALRPDAAQWVVDHGIKLVGIDYLSIEPYGSEGLPTHKILLQANVVILEGVDLRSVRPGPVTLYCLPLKVVGADGAPARVVIDTEVRS